MKPQVRMRRTAAFVRLLGEQTTASGAAHGRLTGPARYWPAGRLDDKGMDRDWPFRSTGTSAVPRRAQQLPGTPAVGRLLRFVITGALTTATAYLVFVGLISFGVHYLVANVFAWSLSLLVGFAINRRFTFQIRGATDRTRHFGLYVLGAVLQLMLGSFGYWVLIGRLRLDATPAFALNLIVTSTFNYLFLNLVAFRPAEANR